MKILFPRNIEKGIISGLNFRIGPFTVSLIQLLILTIGGALMLATVNSLLQKGYDKMLALIIASPIMLVFAIIAFFKISELTLIPFFAKLIRNRFLDVVEKFQVNFPKASQLAILLQKNTIKEKKKEITQKTYAGRKKIIDTIEHEGII